MINKNDLSGRRGLLNTLWAVRSDCQISGFFPDPNYWINYEMQVLNPAPLYEDQLPT